MMILIQETTDTDDIDKVSVGENNLKIMDLEKNLRLY